MPHLYVCVCVCLYLAANSNASTIECLGSKDDRPKTVSIVTSQVMQNSTPEISQGFGVGQSVEIHQSSEIPHSSVITQSAGIPQSCSYTQSVQRISGWLPVITCQFNIRVVQGNVMHSS